MASRSAWTRFCANGPVLALVAWSLGSLPEVAHAVAWQAYARHGEGTASFDPSSVQRVDGVRALYRVRTRISNPTDGAAATLAWQIVDCDHLSARALEEQSVDARERPTSERVVRMTQAQAIAATASERFEFNARVSPLCDAITRQARRDGVRQPGAGAGALLRQAPLLQAGRVYGVRARINDRIDAVMLVDTGASVVTIPASLGQRLRDEAGMSDADVIGRRRLVTADGRTVGATLVRLRSIDIAGHVVRDVEAALLDTEGPVLLGQSYLGRLRHWTLNAGRASFEFVP